MSSLDDSLEPDTADTAREALRRDVEAMVSLRVLRWNGIELHESALITSATTEDTTQQRFSPDQIVERDRAERARVTMAASGGPVRRLSATRE